MPRNLIGVVATARTLYVLNAGGIYFSLFPILSKREANRSDESEKWMPVTIRKGRTQTGWAIERYCLGPIVQQQATGCGALILVQQGDVTRHNRTDYLGDRDYWCEWKCPECGCINRIPDWEVPA